jgi:hypothetical protein
MYDARYHRRVFRSQGLIVLTFQNVLEKEGVVFLSCIKQLVDILNIPNTASTENFTQFRMG